MNGIYRKEKDGIVMGLCCGVADSLKIDVNILRTICVLFTVINSFGLILYVTLSYLIPLE